MFFRSFDITDRLKSYWKSRPVAFSFYASLVVSLVAAINSVAIGRDAALYLDVALVFQESGWHAAYERFDWPWYSIFLGVLHKVTHIPLIPLAYIVNALFMAGVCALLVKLVTDKVPEAGWWACLVVLAVPAFNEYRDDIWREFGFWFFSILSLYRGIVWSEKGGWRRALSVYAAIFFAALFRLEALFLVAAICAWQVVSIRSRADVGKAFQLVFIPVLGLACLLLVLLFMEEGGIDRITYYAEIINPAGIVESFGLFASSIAESMSMKYSVSEAGEIAFFGIIGTLLYGFIKGLGVFLVPYLFMSSGFSHTQLRRTLSLFNWTFFFYFIVLLVFFLKMQFTTGRYSSLLAMLVVPLTAVMALHFSKKHPKLGKVLVVLGLISILVNVVSLSAGRTHYKEAAYWVKENVAPEARVYFMDRRMEFYAGREVVSETHSQEEVMQSGVDQYEYFVLRYAADDPEVAGFIGLDSIRVVTEFRNADNDVLTIFRNGQPRKTE